MASLAQFEILWVPFQCQSWREFLWMSLQLLTLYFSGEGLMFGDFEVLNFQIFSFF